MVSDDTGYGLDADSDTADDLKAIIQREWNESVDERHGDA
jgi:hypothetical protein